MKINFFLAGALVLSMAGVFSCSTDNEDKIVGDDFANDESVVGATDNLPVIEESASEVSPEVAQEVDE